MMQNRFMIGLALFANCWNTSAFVVSSFHITRVVPTNHHAIVQVPFTNENVDNCYNNNVVRTTRSGRSTHSHINLHMNMGSRSSDDHDDEEDDDQEDEQDFGPQSINVLGTPLLCCCENVGNSGIGTGFYRNGFCSTGEDDLGRHTVCIQATNEFLAYSKEIGNDLSTPMPEYMFPGLKGGDIWCLCAQRWVQAYNDGMAPKLFLQSTHEKTLTYVPLQILRRYAVDGDEADSVLDSLNEQRAKLNDLLKE